MLKKTVLVHALSIAFGGAALGLAGLFTRNPRLDDDLLDRIPFLAVNLHHSDRQHAEIVRAVLGRDPHRAQEAMTAHLDGTAALLRGFLLDETGDRRPGK